MKKACITGLIVFLAVRTASGQDILTLESAIEIGLWVDITT